jgi:hypothetical protein
MKMAKLNLNFHKETGRYEPSKNEIVQIAGIALSVEAIVKTLYIYASESNESTVEKDGVCMGICTALEALMGPIVDYLGEYAGLPAIEEEAKHAS